MHASNETLPIGGVSVGGNAGNLLNTVLHSLDEDKAEDIVTIDLEGKSTIADFMVIANGRSQRQVAAISEKLLQRLKDGGMGRCQVEGMSQADWVLIDAGDVIVHVFRPEVRNFYKLEKMWSVDVSDEAVS